jgi:hypothetical protein
MDNLLPSSDTSSARVAAPGYAPRGAVNVNDSHPNNYDLVIAFHGAKS